MQNCKPPSTNNFAKTSINEWRKWLAFLSNYFSSGKINSILSNKPLCDTRPYLNIKINDVDACGLLDSGSAVTIIGNNAHLLLTNLGFEVFPKDIRTLTSAAGHKLKSIGTMILPISFEESFHIINVHVIPEIEQPLILGIDFLRKFNLCPKYLGSSCLTEKESFTNIINNSIVSIHSYNNLNSSQQDIVNDIIKQYKQISFAHKGLGLTNILNHKIDTGNSEPIRQRYYRMSPAKQQILQQQVDEMLALDVIEPSDSAWSSPVLIVQKKNGEPRLCLDSRKLNSVTKKDSYSLPYISEILDNLRDAKFLTSLDISKAFWQISIIEEDRDKTSFYVPGRGSYQFKRTAFGLTNAPATQQRLVDKLFGPEFEYKVFAYLDDIIVISNTFNEHVSLLKRVLNKLKFANLTLNLDKCYFFRDSLKYLGYVVDSQGLRTDPEKVEAILNFPTPKSKKDLKRFLGTATWYRRFVPQFSTIAGPLNRLTSQKKDSPPFSWTTEADNAFHKLKEFLISAPVLSCPDYELPFEVHTDASNYGIGGMLTQTIAGKEHPVAYMSKSLSQSEKNYSITERETLAVLTAIEHWRCYLDNGKAFTVYTDHSALKWFLSLSNPTGRLARWGVRLSSFNFEIKHRKGADNIIPDALSRAVPCSTINISDSFKTTNDQWYLDIYNGCLTKPTSFPNYMIINNSLYRLMKTKCTLQAEFAWKEVVPIEHRTSVIIENHSEPTAAHLGIFKTYRRLALNYYWPNMHSDVVQFISTCDVCSAYKLPTHGTLGEMGRPKQCCRPFQMLSMDLVGPLPASRKQNTYLFVVTCCFSKYCLIFPIRSATAENICKILENSIFLVHGIPQTIFSDNGSQFISSNLTNLLNRYKIPNVFLTPKYTPQVNTVERYNKTIITCISALINNNDQRTWDINISKIQFAINNSINESTGYTPSFLVFGRELVSCGSHYTDTEIGDEIVFLPRDLYAENLGHLTQIFDKVQVALWEAHLKNTSRYNLRRKSTEFNVGDFVWKRTYHLSEKDKYFSKKLAPKFIKCKVISKKSPLVYVLEDMSGKNLGNWHVKDLKK